MNELNTYSKGNWLHNWLLQFKSNQITNYLLSSYITFQVIKPKIYTTKWNS